VYETTLLGSIELGGCCRPAGDRNTDFHEKLVLSGWRTDAQYPRGLLRSIAELTRCVGWDVQGVASSHDRFLATKGYFYLALQNGERLLEIVAMGRRPVSCWGEIYID
jgi:hypothetical protein